jgi:hypothetical protein
VNVEETCDLFQLNPNAECHGKNRVIVESLTGCQNLLQRIDDRSGYIPAAKDFETSRIECAGPIICESVETIMP